MSENVRIHTIIRWITLAGVAGLMLIATTATAQTPPDGFNALVAQANAAREQNDVSDAIHLYEKAEQMNPAWPDGWWYVGSLQYAAGAYGPAVEALSHYIALLPKAGPAYALRGLSEFEEGNFPLSLQDIQQAIALGAANDPRNAGILVFHEAELMGRLGNYEGALTKYKMLIEHGAGSQNVIEGLGLAGLRMPILPSDIPASQQDFVSQVGNAAAYVMGGKTADGQQAFQAIFLEHPDTPNVHYFYGYLLSMIDPAGAVAQFRAELRISPDSALANSMLAWDLGMQGNYRAALPYASASVKEDPTLPMAQLVMGKDLVETGNSAASLTYLNALIAGFPDNLDAHLALAKAYSELGQSKEARQQRLLCLAISKKRAITPDAEL